MPISSARTCTTWSDGRAVRTTVSSEDSTSATSTPRTRARKRVVPCGASTSNAALELDHREDPSPSSTRLYVCPKNLAGEQVVSTTCRHPQRAPSSSRSTIVPDALRGRTDVSRTVPTGVASRSLATAQQVTNRPRGTLVRSTRPCSSTGEQPVRPRPPSDEATYSNWTQIKPLHGSCSGSPSSVSSTAMSTRRSAASGSCARPTFGGAEVSAGAGTTSFTFGDTSVDGGRTSRAPRSPTLDALAIGVVSVLGRSSAVRNLATRTAIRTTHSSPIAMRTRVRGFRCSRFEVMFAAGIVGKSRARSFRPLPLRAADRHSPLRSRRTGAFNCPR